LGGLAPFATQKLKLLLMSSEWNFARVENHKNLIAFEIKNLIRKVMIGAIAMAP